ncbi:MAG: hypothetical protein JSU94_05440 [Phycisphaerales bacterium]|nr:MAG: hypothetical protein JSU94_05440 [Phycisphaerales bacterium]
MKTVVRTITVVPLKVVVCAAAYVLGVTFSGIALTKLGIQVPSANERVDPEKLMPCLLLGSLLLSAMVAPLAGLMRGPYVRRWAALFALALICLGLNTAIEAAIFTEVHGIFALTAFQVLPALLFSAAISLLFRSRRDGTTATNQRFLSELSGRRWALRIALAVSAFPIIYYAFGMMVAPFVIEYYRQGQFGLTLPPVKVIISVQLLRSALYMLCSLAVLTMASGSRRRQVLGFGLAFYVLTGLFGMIQAYWLPTGMRLLHGAEILGDSMAYAVVMTALFTPRTGSARTASPVALSAAHC